MVADQNGGVSAANTFNFTPFGEAAGNDPGSSNQQGFTGHIEDETGLTYMQARYYDPVIGRFLSADPIGYADGLNVYAYVRNDPVNKTDPTGMTEEAMMEIVITAVRPRPPIPVTLPAHTGVGAATAGGMATVLALPIMILTPSNGWTGSEKIKCMDESFCHQAMNEVDDAIDDIAGDGTSKGNHTEVDNRGENQAADFEKIAKASGGQPRPIETQYGPGQVIDLPGGGTASTRPGSSTGPGTIQIDRPGQPKSRFAIDGSAHMGQVDGVTELSVIEFDDKWRRHYDSIFVDRDIDKMPFRPSNWSHVCIGAPAYYFDSERTGLTAEQIEHLNLYSAVERAITAMGDGEIIGFLRNGPYSNPSIFRGSPPFARAMYHMRSKAVDGFDLDIFAASKAWGVIISWEEEVALVGGDSAFTDILERIAGGRDAIRRNFEWATGYLHEVGDRQRELAIRLRSACFPD